MKLSILSFFFLAGTQSAAGRLSASGSNNLNDGIVEQDDSDRELLVATLPFLSTCSNDGDCNDYCNTNVGRCDRKQTYERYALCSVDTHCQWGGKTFHCNTNVDNDDIKFHGLGLCQRVPNGNMVAFCAEDDDCNGALVCGNQANAYGQTCAKKAHSACGGNYQCQSNLCEDDRCTIHERDAHCWEQNVDSVSYRDGDDMPSPWIGYTERNHKHTLASNEYVVGHCGCYVADKIKNDPDLSYSDNVSGVDRDARSVNCELRNYGDSFTFYSNQLGAGCKVDRYIC